MALARADWNAARAKAVATAKEPGPEAAAPKTGRLEREREFEKSRWRQYLQTTRYDGVTYLDEGGASSESKSSAAR